MAWNMEPLKEHIVSFKDNGIYEITAPPMRYKEYVIEGDDRAVLIDTGFGFDSILPVVKSITDKPVTVINTHGHPDHCGGNAEFDQIYMNKEDLDLLHGKGSYESRIRESATWHIEGSAERLMRDGADPEHIEDGTVMDLGGREVRIIYTPGHSRGSITIIDSKTGAAFSGDNVMAFGAMLMEKCAAPLSVYIESLKRLKAENPSVIYSGHMPGQVSPCIIDKLIKLAERVLNGEQGEPFKNPMGEGLRIEGEGVALGYNPEYVL